MRRLRLDRFDPRNVRKMAPNSKFRRSLITALEVNSMRFSEDVERGLYGWYEPHVWLMGIMKFSWLNGIIYGEEHNWTRIMTENCRFFKLLQLRKWKRIRWESILSLISKSKASILTIPSFFLKIFLHRVAGEKTGVFLFSKIIKIRNVENLKQFLSCNLLHHGFENWNFLFTISWNLLYEFLFCNFIELWTLKLDDEMLGFFEYLLLNSNVQSSMKWPKKNRTANFLNLQNGFSNK